MQAGIEQVDPSSTTDLTQKSGYLAKRPENVLWLARKQWPKKYCTVSKNGFTMANSHVSIAAVVVVIMVGERGKEREIHVERERERERERKREREREREGGREGEVT